MKVSIYSNLFFSQKLTQIWEFLQANARLKFEKQIMYDENQFVILEKKSFSY